MGLGWCGTCHSRPRPGPPVAERRSLKGRAINLKVDRGGCRKIRIPSHKWFVGFICLLQNFSHFTGLKCCLFLFWVKHVILSL